MTLPAVKEALVSQQKAIESVLPAHIEPKKFMRTALSAIQNAPDIAECEVQSVMVSCQKAAQDGLVLDGREAALVSFNTKEGGHWVKKAQYMPMVNGILKKLRNSGQLSTITAQIVYSNDDFKYNPGTGEMHHNPDWFGDRGTPIGVYAVAELKDGGRQIEIMNQDQLDEVRRVSKSGSDKEGNPKGIWKQWPQEMWKKTVLRRIAKYLPSSADIDMMWENDNDDFDFNDQPAPAAKPVRATADDINSALADEPEAETAPPIEGEIVDSKPTVDDNNEDLI